MMPSGDLRAAMLAATQASRAASAAGEKSSAHEHESPAYGIGSGSAGLGDMRLSDAAQLARMQQQAAAAGGLGTPLHDHATMPVPPGHPALAGALPLYQANMGPVYEVSEIGTLRGTMRKRKAPHVFFLCVCFWFAAPPFRRPSVLSTAHFIADLLSILYTLAAVPLCHVSLSAPHDGSPPLAFGAHDVPEPLSLRPRNAAVDLNGKPARPCCKPPCPYCVSYNAPRPRPWLTSPVFIFYRHP
jgi:hypothetical protein